ncbi:MAG TPA: hypothetical protein VE221_09500 [Sphingomicrobium sp.]|nr:hypothetical protein [Sphingomicrobium sp.]
MQAFDIGTYLAALPRRDIGLLPLGTDAPKPRANGSLQNYNGFSGKERLRTFELAKWLHRSGAMPHTGECSICGSPADQQHAEDYFDLTTWMDICRGCHVSLHGRFATPDAWRRRVQQFHLPSSHWACALPSEEPDIAAFHRLRGRGEPTASDFIMSASDG